ncbi:MAG: glycosyltransferase family 2 protein, partial [Candidatus Methylomirabilis sp.]
MKREDLVSVIVPAYDAARFIRDALTSALSQSHRHIEVIVVDDASGDGTARIVSEMALADPRVRPFFHDMNQGPGASRNKAIREARGKYLAFLDADDVWEPDKLRAQMDLLLRPSVGLVYSAMSEIDEQGVLRHPYRGRRQRPSGDIAEALFWHNWVPTSTVVIRKTCIEQAGNFDEAQELI